MPLLPYRFLLRCSVPKLTRLEGEMSLTRTKLGLGHLWPRLPGWSILPRLREATILSRVLWTSMAWASTSHRQHCGEAIPVSGEKESQCCLLNPRSQCCLLNPHYAFTERSKRGGKPLSLPSLLKLAHPGVSGQIKWTPSSRHITVICQEFFHILWGQNTYGHPPDFLITKTQNHEVCSIIEPLEKMLSRLLEAFFTWRLWKQRANCKGSVQNKVQYKRTRILNILTCFEPACILYGFHTVPVSKLELRIKQSSMSHIYIECRPQAPVWGNKKE